MIFEPLHLAGANLIGIEAREDERGMFARLFCAREFGSRGLETCFVQENVSRNRLAGTLRGMHAQREPHAEVKVVRCVRGAVYDVIVDLRPTSPTYLDWYGAELTEQNGLMLYVPRGFAHGYLTLTDSAAVHYLVSGYYEPGAEQGLRYDDPAVGIRWPATVASISPKDGSWPLLKLACERGKCS
jgi:dTDP-4-dehydrorhamnose 3,5-epimerase